MNYFFSLSLSKRYLLHQYFLGEKGVEGDSRAVEFEEDSLISIVKFLFFCVFSTSLDLR
jgi:hypothetical protein